MQDVYARLQRYLVKRLQRLGLNVTLDRLPRRPETSSWSFSKELCNNPPRKVCLETI